MKNNMSVKVKSALGRKNIIKIAVLVLFASLFVGSATPVLAYSPVLSAVYQGGTSGNVQINVSNSNPFSGVNLSYRQSSSLWTQVSNIGQTDGGGNFTSVVSLPGDGSGSPLQIYVTVGGQQSSTVQLYPNGNNNNGCGYYGCNNVGGLTLSQSSVSLNVGQSVSVTASAPIYGYSNNVYVSSNSSPSVASASVSGNQVTVYGISSGSTTISICLSSGSSMCASLYVTVSGGSNCYNGSGYNCGNTGNVWFNPANPTMYVGQSLAVSINSSVTNNAYGAYAAAYYSISSNSNTSVVTGTVNGTVLNLYAAQSGSASLVVCSNSLNFCGTLYVTVNGSGNCGYYGCGTGLTLSQTSLSLTAGQGASVTVTNNNSGGTPYISSNSNSGVASATVSGNAIYVTGISSGTTNISICQNNASQCATLSVTVSGSNCGYYGCNNGLVLSQNNLSLNVGQSFTVGISSSNYYGGSYYIASNSNGIVASANVSGSSVYVNALNAGTTNISVCQSSTSVCATLYVTVGGGGSGTGFSLSQTSLAINIGQSSTVAIYGNGNYYLASNSNSSVVSATIYGSSLSLNGLIAGSSVLSICQTGSTYQCASLYVTVNGYNYGGYGSGGSLTFSPASVNIGVGQNATVSILNNNYGYATGYYISNNNNSYVATVSLSGNQLNIYGLTAGTGSVTVCQSNDGCGSLYINVGGSGSYYTGSGLSLSQTSLSLNSGQTQAITIYGNGSYYVSSNSNQSVATANMSGNVLNVYGSNSGSTTISVCQSNPSTCASVYVTVNGNYYNNGGNGGGLQYPGGSGSGGGVLGASIYPNGTLISSGGTVYIVYKNTVSAFASSWAFTGLGFNFGNVLAVGNSGLANSGYIVSTPYARHPWGSWIKNGSTIYFVYEQGLIPVPDWSTFLNNGGQTALIVPANSYDFKLPILTPMTAGDSRLQ
ncbi:MAG: pilus assembly protein N-terminal domain-containing protein [Candidatus Doudnabacteria bacterium]|nr:pilus assembly protein N-terminal domain-containing protein [Candidatus Doudnabacteria bacterium]